MAYAAKRITALWLVACILCLSVTGVCLRPKKVEATAILETAGKLASYFLTTAGAINIGTDGGASRVGGSIFDSIRQKIADVFGTGIYEDSSGNYVFNEAASKELYDLLNSNPNINARVISDFPTAAYLQSDYSTPNFNGEVNNAIHLYNNQVLIGSSVFKSGNDYHTNAYVCDFHDVAYCSILVSSYDSREFNLKFFDSSGNLLTVNATSISQTYYSSNGTFSTVKVSAVETESCSAGSRSDSDTDKIYLYLPNRYNRSGTYYYNNIYASRSIIVGKSANQASQLYNIKAGNVINNYYTTIPKVQKTVIDNNDWSNIYTSYVTNVNNNKEIYYNEETGVDMEALRSVMKTFGDQISVAIEEGATDINERINFTNDWLQKIYERLGVIYDWLSDGGSTPNSGGGSGSGSGSSVDYTNLLQTINTSLSGIGSDVSDSNATLLNIYAYLDMIVGAINRLNSGTGVDGSPNITLDNVYTDLLDISTDGIDGFLTQGQVFTSVAKAVVPLCYLTVLSSILQGIATTPPQGYAPSWNIPFQLDHQGVISVDETVTVSLEGFSNVHDILIAMECIAFIIFLIFVSFRLLKVLLDIFG